VPTAAVIGLGDISTVHLPAISRLEGVRLVGVADVDPARAAAGGAAYDVPSFTDHRELLARLRPDVVHVCTPHDQHVPVALDALDAGAHVLTEKPIAHTVAEGRRLVDRAATATAAGQRIGVCFQNRYNATSVALKDALASGRYGTVHGARASVWWHRAPAYYAAAPWRGEWARAGGGTLINQAIHTLDLLLWLLGDVAPDGIFGRAGQRALRGTIAVEDTADVWLTHLGGVRSGLFATNAHVTNAPVMLEITTDHGALRLDDGVLEWREHDAADPTLPQILARDIAPSGTRSYWGASHERLVEEFYATLDQPGRFWIGPEQGLAPLTVLRTVYAQSGLIPADQL
jgi:UDP-N-acetyl-2-amino-2-deoxyglucuronate dehydrogenase